MEGLSHLVSASLARHGFTTQLDHRRLQWSNWFRCESSFSVLLVPSKPGVFALAEETTAMRTFELDEKRLLTLYRISETEDLGMALGRLFLPNSPDSAQLSKKGYVRYAVIEDEGQRQSIYRSLQEWMAAATSDSANEIPDNLTVHSFVRGQDAEDATSESPLVRTGT